MGAIFPAGGRLLIAIAEVLAKREGLNYGMCDTDSFAFLRPKGMSRQLFREKVYKIAGSKGLFQNLNPYAPTVGKVDDIFAIEDGNAAFKIIENEKTGAVKIGAIEDKEGNLVLKPLYIFCISAKRYALANIVKPNGDDYADIDEMKKDAANAHVILRKATGHGLGHVTAPGYISFQPSHDAAPWTETKSAAQLSEPKYGEVCKGRGNPRLFLDLWRMAIMNFISVNNIEDATIVADYMDDTIRSLTGLGLIQKQQRTLGTRAAMEQYIGMKVKRPFMFMDVLPPPVLQLILITSLPMKERRWRNCIRLHFMRSFRLMLFQGIR